MRIPQACQSARCGLLLVGLATLLVLPVWANEKEGMPDLSQEEQTCLPTSTANIIVWFGNHGYPKLIVDGDSKEDDYIHTVHAIITATDARYDWGTRTDAITYGITKYIHDAGYGCDVEYRGIDWSQAKFPDVVKDDDAEKYKPYQKTPVAFTPDWLQENDDPNKCFLLLLAYVKFDQGSNTFSDAINAGHAVTLVNAEPGMLLIHDPAHDNDEPGRKILTPEPLTGGTFQLPGYNAPVAGLMLLSGSLLDTPPDAQVLLTGAVCVTMHQGPGSSDPGSDGLNGSKQMIAGAGSGDNHSSSPSSPETSKQSAAPNTWWMAVFDWLFKN